MAVKASATVTLSCYRDTKSVTRYYKLQSSTASAPSKPTSNPPSGWNDSEPSYSSGSTNTLYFCDLTEFSDGTWAYSAVSKSSSYEAAKEAYNKAQNAQSTADSANNKIDDLEIGGRNYLFTNRCFTVTNNGITFTPKEDGGIMISGTNETPRGYGTAYSFPAGVTKDNEYYSLFAGTYTLSLSGSEHYMNMITDGSKFYYRLKRDKLYGSDIPYTFNGTSIVFTLNEDVEKVYIGFGFYSNAEIVDGTVYLKLEKGNKATDWTPAPEDVDANIANEKPVINGTQTSATYSWTGVAPFKELKDGQKITYWLPFSCAGSYVSMPYWKDSEGTTQQSTNSGSVLNLTLSDGSTTGNVSVYYSGSSRLTSHFTAGNAIELTYKKLVKIGGYYYTGWWANANYNVDTLDNRISYFTGKTGSKGIWAYSLFMEDSSGTYQNICTASDGTVTASNKTTAKTKKANTNGFKIGSSIYYTTASSYNQVFSIENTSFSAFIISVNKPML